MTNKIFRWFNLVSRFRLSHQRAKKPKILFWARQPLTLSSSIFRWPKVCCNFIPKQKMSTYLRNKLISDIITTRLKRLEERTDRQTDRQTDRTQNDRNPLKLSLSLTSLIVKKSFFTQARGGRYFKEKDYGDEQYILPLREGSTFHKQQPSTHIHTHTRMPPPPTHKHTHTHTYTHGHTYTNYPHMHTTTTPHTLSHTPHRPVVSVLYMWRQMTLGIPFERRQCIIRTPFMVVKPLHLLMQYLRSLPR